jgi:hypothetical protein
MKWLRGYERFVEAKTQFKVQAQNDLEKTIYKNFMPRLSQRSVCNTLARNRW